MKLGNNARMFCSLILLALLGASSRTVGSEFYFLFYNHKYERINITVQNLYSIVSGNGKAHRGMAKIFGEIADIKFEQEVPVETLSKFGVMTSIFGRKIQVGQIITVWATRSVEIVGFSIYSALAMLIGRICALVFIVFSIRRQIRLHNTANDRGSQ